MKLENEKERQKEKQNEKKQTHHSSLGASGFRS